MKNKNKIKIITIAMLFFFSITIMPHGHTEELKAEGDVQIYEYYSGPMDDRIWANPRTQTFTIGTVGKNESFYVTKAVVNLNRIGGSGGGVVSIHQGGPNLVSASLPDVGYGWTTFDFASPAILHKGEQYSLVVYCSSNTIQWTYGSDGYAGGTGYSGKDFLFEIWGYNFSNLPPNQPTNEIPANNSDYEDVYDISLSCNVSDSNGEDMNVTFYWANGTAIATVTAISNNSQASIYLPDYIEPDWFAHDTTFYWYVNVTDGINITIGPTWNFKTCKAWDLNADRTVNYLDVSSLVSHYRETVTPGAEPWDIIEDGVDNYLDISSLVSHYRETY